MRLIIAGGRDFHDIDRAREIVSKINITEIVSGGAKGADTVGESLAKELNIPIKRFIPDWSGNGKSAGMIRNKDMAKYGDALLAFWDGSSPGTKNMIDEAKSEQLHVLVENYEVNHNVKHVIYDFETVDKLPTSAIASVAVIVFDPCEMKTFDELVKSALRIKFKLADQFKDGRTYSKETIDWWKLEENKDAYDKVIAPSTEDVPLSQFGPLLTDYLDKMGYKPNIGEKIWTRGNSFDPPIMTNIYNHYGWEEPTPWWALRDVRTEIDAITPYWDSSHSGYGYVNSFGEIDGFIKHMETHDCARDILMMQYTHLKLIEHMNK